MKSHGSLARLSLVLAALSLIPCLGLAKPQTEEQTAREEVQKPTPQRRQEARERLQQMLRNLRPELAPKAEPMVPLATQTKPPQGLHQDVDITKPNWSYSPNLRKFVDSLPGLTATYQNNLGQYIPIAEPDRTTYPGSDYYEIALVEYREQMHSDLPALNGDKMDPMTTGGTKLRGYVQLNGGDGQPHYLGPIIIAKRDRPVRVKFVNMLPTGMGGDLFVPVDPSIMGSGMFHSLSPDGGLAMGMFTQNRATLHLHGGLSPWISDGTPHQWITPAGEDMTIYTKGVATTNVPDMPDPGPGAMNFYWTNGQSARLMFYHDHAWGITRLNVYVGEAAGYLLTDMTEERLIDSGFLPNWELPYRYGVPLIIQDKSFVNDGVPHPDFPSDYTPTSATSVVDPLWNKHISGSAEGDLWFPHEYLPNENLFDGTGFWPMGRWDYGPWILPPMFPTNDTLPSPSHVPEAFLDTMVVNGTAYPYVELPATVVRLRILNACNDRMLNLQLYEADPLGFQVVDANGDSWGTEVKMVPAAPNEDFPDWPRDGRDGGVPDPLTSGPEIIQIGNESGFLSQVARIPAQPIDYDYDRTSATFGSVSSVSLFLPPAVRADVLVDLRGYEGKTLILYNDAPAPIPLFDARYDIFTKDPVDRTVKGGVPMIPPGFGPNTRTIMQIRVVPTTIEAPRNFDRLDTAIPQAFAASHEPHVVPPGIYATVADETLNVTGGQKPVARILTEAPGFGYTSPPRVTLYGSPGTVITPGTAHATLNGVSGVIVTNGGSGYTSPPTVTFTGGGGTGAAAQAIVSGGVVTAVVMTELGSNYTTSPTVTLSGGGGTGATAIARVTLGTVGSIVIDNPGLYTKAPYVFFSGGGGMGAAGAAMLQGDMPLDGKTIVEGMDMEYGRMNAVLGSIPNPFTPTVGAGPIPGASFYIDPPTEILNPDEERLWRLTHIGVDSHAVHFHLFDVQVVNRVDWTNTVSPPYAEEMGWKETIRTNPFEDIILALRPKVSNMKLPFGLPDSVRLLDPSMPPNEPGHFQPIPPPIGVPSVAQITNVMTNFGWEYVWHCHLLGHEENDMMRPIVFKVPSERPAQFDITSAIGTQTECTINWTDTTPFDYASWSPATTLGNPANEIGFRIERATGQSGTDFVPVGTALANHTTYVDRSITPGQYYRYRVVSFNAAGSRNSNIVTVRAGNPPPNAPSNLTATPMSGPMVRLSWSDNATNETGFEIQRSDNGGAFATLTTVGPRTGTGTVTYDDTNVAVGNSYTYRVRATASVGEPSAFSNEATANVTTAPTAPSNLTGTISSTGNSTSITLRWIDNSANETGFIIQRATNASFTGANQYTVGANTTTYRQPVSRRTTYYYRVAATSAGGTSAWSNTVMLRTP